MSGGFDKRSYLASSPESIWITVVKMEQGKENCGKDYGEKIKIKSFTSNFCILVILL